MLRGGLRLLLPLRLDPAQRHVRLAPEFRGFPALAEGEADHGDGEPLLGMQRDGTTRAPNEIGRMRADHQRRLVCLAHDAIPFSPRSSISAACSPMPGGSGGVPWVWKLSTVFRPQAWPFLRSVSV